MCYTYMPLSRMSMSRFILMHGYCMILLLIYVGYNYIELWVDVAESLVTTSQVLSGFILIKFMELDLCLSKYEIN